MDKTESLQEITPERLDLHIEVLEKKVEIVAAAGTCTSTSTSCSSIQEE